MSAQTQTATALIRSYRCGKTDRREAMSVLDGRRQTKGDSLSADSFSTHSFSTDLTLIDEGRNVNPFVSGDWSPHSTFGLRSAWSLLRARRSQSTSVKHPITGTVEEGRSRRETA